MAASFGQSGRAGDVAEEVREGCREEGVPSKLD